MNLDVRKISKKPVEVFTSCARGLQKEIPYVRLWNAPSDQLQDHPISEGTNGIRPQRFDIMRKRSTSTIVLTGVIVIALTAVGVSGSAETVDNSSRICRPVLQPCPVVLLGDAGTFRWTCEDGRHPGNGFYIVFVRPGGTYVLLKVPRGRTVFEFTPDMPGAWRWIVINTDPDRTKPDLESEPGRFEVIEEAKKSSGAN